MNKYQDFPKILLYLAVSIVIVICIPYTLALLKLWSVLKDYTISVLGLALLWGVIEWLYKWLDRALWQHYYPKSEMWNKVRTEAEEAQFRSVVQKSNAIKYGSWVLWLLLSGAFLICVWQHKLPAW